MFGALLSGALTGAAPAWAIVSPKPANTPTFNGIVWATAYAGNTIYVGGDFTAALVAGKPVPRVRLAAINATTGALLDWSPDADGRVRAIAVTESAVYVTGQFSTIDGVKRDSLARLDPRTGAVSTDFQHSVGGSSYALAIGSGRLFAGGAFTDIDGQQRSRLAAFRLDTGALDPQWRPSADDQVETMVATSNRVYVGGKFHKINGARGTSRLAAITPDTGRVVSTFNAAATYIAYGIAVSGSRVYAAHGGQGGRVISYDLNGAKRWSLTMDGDARAVAILGGVIYIGGHFDNVCRSVRTGDQGRCLDGSVARVKLAATDDQGRLQPWEANGNGVAGVLTMASNAGLGKLSAGGAFTMLNGQPQKRFVQFG